MPRRRLPAFQKVPKLKLLRIFIFLAEMRKFSFDKYSSLVRKISQRRSKKLRFMEHYNYGFLGEYEFSPSNTPLIQYPRNKFAKNRSGPQDVYSLFFLCRCWGSLRVLEGDQDGDFAMKARPAAATADTEDANALAIVEAFDWGNEDVSIDMRAQRFIESFYEEMRMQRQESI